MAKLLFIAFILFNSVSFAALQVGKILNYTGVNYTINDKKVGVEAPLFWGDRLLTGKGTTVEIVIYPNFVLKIHPSSKLKIVGSIIEQMGEKLGMNAAIKLNAGKIQAAVYKNAKQINNIKIFGTKTISSIRGTTFEVDADSAQEMTVFEGEVEVEVPSLGQSQTLGANEAIKVNKKELSKTVSEKSSPTLVSEQKIATVWSADSESVMASHRKEAKKYKEILDKDVKGFSDDLKKDAASMFKGLRGNYGTHK